MPRRRNRKVGLCMPGYNWCGPGCSGPGRPTNPVDYCCMQHDLCYKKYGPTRYCDYMFRNCLRPYTYQRTRMGRDARLFSSVIGIKSLFF